nr:MATE family efflux transporter [uncultured Chryseobacterium sp.]
MKKYLIFLKKAFSEEDTDYTKISIRSAVLLLAIPMMLEMAMESVFALVDLYFVGHLKESGFAIQTVGLTESVLTIIYSIAIGMSMAATAVVARRIGEKNPEQASRSAAQVISVSFIITSLLSVLGVIYAEDILILMGSKPDAAKYGKEFTQIMMGSSVIIMLLFLINGIFRGAGNAAIAMKSLWIANIANIILCPLLIRGLGPIPAMGLTGAAVATSIGRSSGVLYQLYHIFIADSLVRIRTIYFKPDFKLITSILKIAMPGILQFVIASCSWIFLAQLVATTGGKDASAGYQTALRLMMFFMLPAWGLSNAASTLVGQNMGAGEMLRAEQSVTKTVKYNVIFMLLVSLLFFISGDFLVGFFTEQIEIKNYAKNALHIMSIGFVFYGIGMVTMNAFNGAGDTWTPTWLNFLGFWMFQIPLAYALSKYFQLGPKGVFISVPVAETFITVIAFILFKKGKWKNVKV